ncbi:MAG TPA: prepilin-type N-terminal cleavage/methylation domain-containing protein [Acidimicrobiales bacterium]|nr:prepilin-type N-terminal cleavage/methylation domain-containing protein [Acidimicrobiales bacterium]
MLKSTLTRLRETRMQELDGDGAADAGFTLIELMVVLLIIAILLAIAIPTFLGVANSAGDRASQSNLTNALTEVKALYQNNAAYTTGSPLAPMTTALFTASAPEFSWASAACTGSSAGNCVSVQVVDSSAASDSQGVELAVYSAKTTTCWYAVDLESTPTTITDTSPLVSFWTAGTHVQSGATTAGVFYAKKTGAGASAACVGGYPSMTAATFSWGQSYSSAPTN